MDLILYYMDSLGVDEDTAKTLISTSPSFASKSQREAVHDPQAYCKELANKYPQRGIEFFEDNVTKLIFAFSENSVSHVLAEVQACLGNLSATATQSWQTLCHRRAFTFDEFSMVSKESLQGCILGQEIKKTCDLFDRLLEKSLIIEETYLGV